MAQFPNQICIAGGSRGFIVDIGCKRLIFTDDEINEFLADLKSLMTGGSKKYDELYRAYFPEDFDEKAKKGAMIARGINHLAPPPPCDFPEAEQERSQY